MSSRESLFEFLELKARECRPIASLLPFLRILVVEIDVAVI